VKAHAGIPARLGAQSLLGRVLCHDVREAGKLVFRKGDVLDADGARRLAAVAHDEVHLIEPEAGDLHEDAAGQRLAQAAATAALGMSRQSRPTWSTKRCV